MIAEYPLMQGDGQPLSEILFIGAGAYVGPGDGWCSAAAADEGDPETYDKADAPQLVSRLNDSRNFTEYRLVIQDSLT